MRKLALNDEILLSIQQPARYIGGEVNTVNKDPEKVDIRFAMCFPDVYEIGMSHLGMQILYDMFNRREDIYCERVYSPWTDLDKIMGLGTGADDYVTKPFNPLELTARVKSQLRRYTQLNPNSAVNEKAGNEITIRGLIINKDNHKVTVYGEEIKLTPIEFDILYLLASNPGRVFSTDEIFEKVWNEKVYEANNTVMVHIRRLRGKMKEDTRQNKIITTVWGVGYKIEK